MRNAVFIKEKIYKRLAIPLLVTPHDAWFRVIEKIKEKISWLSSKL